MLIKEANIIGEKVGNSKVDKHRERVVLENLPSRHWIERHNTMAQKIAAVCMYAGIPVEREPFGLFRHLVPQQALNRLQQNQVSQVLSPDLRLEVPQKRAKPPDRYRRDRNSSTAQPAQSPVCINSPIITKVKVLSKGIKAHYKAGSGGRRAVESRVAEIPGKYRRKVAKMDQVIQNNDEEGPCMRRLK